MKIAPKFKFDLDYKVSPKVIIIALSVVLCALLLVVAVRNIPREISLLEYDNFLQSRSIQSAEISGEKLVFHAGGKNYYVLKDSINLNELAQTVAIKAPSEYGEDLFLLVLLAACGFMVFVILRRRQSFAVSATQTAQNDLEGAVSGAQIVPAISNVRFGDVAGIDEVKFELMEIVDSLQKPSRAKRACRFSTKAARVSCKSMSVWARKECANSFLKLRLTRQVSFLSMKSTPWAKRAEEGATTREKPR